MSAWYARVSPEACTREHPNLVGPCVDVGQCPECWMPCGSMRPPGETFGFHARDCSLPERHYGECVGGGTGHKPGHIRGYWPGMDEDIRTELAWWAETNPGDTR